MRAAYAAQRAEIGPRGYEDRIYRRKAKAKPAVHAWTDEAERLLTLRETHRLTGFPPRPQSGFPALRRGHISFRPGHSVHPPAPAFGPGNSRIIAGV